MPRQKTYPSPNFQHLSFHSLQTGTLSTRLATKKCWIESVSGFHSLQTGNHIARKMTNRPGSNRKTGFPFPSNGKPHRKGRFLSDLFMGRLRVSIPFKRENGAQGLRCGDVPNRIQPVSIPFKRETTSQVTVRTTNFMFSIKSFHSLQTGTQSTSPRWHKLWKT